MECLAWTSLAFNVFFSFTHTNGQIYPCALVHWFDHIVDEPDELTGMWMVSPSFLEDGPCNLSVIHVDSIICAAHLLPIFGDETVPAYATFHNSLDICISRILHMSTASLTIMHSN